MAKRNLFRGAGAVFAVLPLLLTGCSHTKAVGPQPVTEPMMTYPSSNNAPSAANAALVPAHKLWTHKVAGLMTDINLSRDGSTVLVATVPDHDSLDPSANHSEHYVTFYSRAGKVLSRTAMPSQVKSQSISDDGSFAVIATYDDQIRGISRDGKQLWSTEASCRPIVLGGPASPLGLKASSEKILCFHDDDAEPDVGFEVFNWAGKRLSGFPIHDDALVLKVAPDERSFILALTHGRVIVFGSRGGFAFRPIARNHVPGEVVDVAISAFAKHGRHGSARPSYAVLYNLKTPSQGLAYFGARSFTLPVFEHAETIAITPEGGAVFGYSNTDSGQVLIRFSKKPRQAWKREDPKTAEYTSRVVATHAGVWVGFQDAHVLGFDDQGGLKTDIRAPGEEGAFLYGFAVSPMTHFVAVGMDDGSLSLFAFKAN